MKKLIILRHAKSSWNDLNEIDIKRKLSNRGKKQLPEIGDFIKKNIAYPDIFITSPAKRAKKTASAIADYIDFDRARIINDIRVYEGDITIFKKILSEISDSFEVVYLCGHNPGLSEVVKEITRKNDIDIPTGGVYEIELDIISWKNEVTNKGRIINTFFPSKKEQSPVE
ncbi:MAG: hypothetical protein A2015_04350 [Spirochaetes bacterium GWF1_31_7]|nr:MAG: hypothetical protein A2Y30_16920 [Spirochaetes bacterium GWE1_32_154]OHD52584.1 MAG: hypothetical protein A2Y29_00030 [Spirochaetes bacterium GWE2_31_10]OHD52952.1 MAG: hypothetical protein A2015_04350 [Spirochaetes bacterium GWF1_31_7]OHD83085.1 MAG: hypothetical protein A2355_18440 [Spirochaetes bacterium RIFOXYB1_FULL_32_8]HBD93695.1 phosphohistidine phosphatase [Spirochaetia bacterium]